jgi:hypothetical protein
MPIIKPERKETQIQKQHKYTNTKQTNEQTNKQTNKQAIKRIQ